MLVGISVRLPLGWFSAAPGAGGGGAGGPGVEAELRGC